MKHIIKNSMICFSILAVLAIPVNGAMAMMGGGGHHGGSYMGDSGWGGNYGGHMGGSPGNMGGGYGSMGSGHGSMGAGTAGYDRHMESGSGDIGHSGSHQTVMSPAAAENRIRAFMNGRTSMPYSMGRTDDTGNYYMTDILGQDGAVVDRVIVDKSTGSVRSIR